MRSTKIAISNPCCKLMEIENIYFIKMIIGEIIPVIIPIEVVKIEIMSMKLEKELTPLSYSNIGPSPNIEK